MACSKCGSNKAKFEVVKDGKVLFQSPFRTTALAVANRYPGSTVREKAAGAAG